MEVDPLTNADPNSEEMIAAIWAEQEAAGERARKTHSEWAPGMYDLEDDYNQTNFLTGGYDRDYSGMSNDWKSKQTVVELEGLIEDVIAKDRLEEKKFKMYKGQVKKW